MLINYSAASINARAIFGGSYPQRRRIAGIRRRKRRQVDNDEDSNYTVYIDCNGRALHSFRLRWTGRLHARNQLCTRHANDGTSPSVACGGVTIVFCARGRSSKMRPSPPGAWDPNVKCYATHGHTYYSLYGSLVVSAIFQHTHTVNSKRTHARSDERTARKHKCN